MSASIEDGWILLSASVIYLVRYAVLVEVYEENSASYRHIVRKGRSILIAFSSNYVQSSLLLHQNMTSGSFLKVSGYVESETIPMNFSMVFLHSEFCNIKH